MPGIIMALCVNFRFHGALIHCPDCSLKLGAAGHGAAQRKT